MTTSAQNEQGPNGSLFAASTVYRCKGYLKKTSRKIKTVSQNSKQKDFNEIAHVHVILKRDYNCEQFSQLFLPCNGCSDFHFHQCVNFS